MSALLTAIPEARTALLDMLRARPGLEGVQITRAAVSADTDRIAAKAMWFGSVDNADQEARVIGNRKRSESFVIEVIVSVKYPGDDIDAAEAAIWPLVRELAGAVREDYTLSGTVDVAQVVPLSFDHYPGPDFRLVESVVGVACKARV